MLTTVQLVISAVLRLFRRHMVIDFFKIENSGLRYHDKYF